MLTSMNIKDLLDVRLINEIQLTKHSYRSEVSINASKDGKLLLVSITNGCATKGAVYVLSKVDDFYIIEGRLDPDDESTSRNYGYKTAIYENEKGYTIAVSDIGYKGSDNITEVGGVFLFQYVLTKKWECIKIITILDNDNEYKYKHVGKGIEFTSTGSLVIITDINDGNMVCNYSQIFLYENNDEEDFKYLLSYTLAEDNTFNISSIVKVVDDIIYIVTTRKNNDKVKIDIQYCDLNKYKLELQKLINYTYEDIYTHIVDFHIYDGKLIVATLNLTGLSSPSIVFDLYRLEKEAKLKAYSENNASLVIKQIKDNTENTTDNLLEPINVLSKDSRVSLDFRNDELFISFLTDTEDNGYNNILVKYNIKDNLQNINNNVYEELYKKEITSSNPNRRNLIYPKICNKLKVTNNDIFFIDREKCNTEQKSIYHLKCI